MTSRRLAIERSCGWHDLRNCKGRDGLNMRMTGEHLDLVGVHCLTKRVDEDLGMTVV
jgi:hypothetical protein